MLPVYDTGDSNYDESLKLPVELNVEFMIDTLAEAHGISKRKIEKKYTKYDYFIFVTRKNLEVAKELKRQEKSK